MGASICWVATETDTPFAIFDLSALEKQLLILVTLCDVPGSVWSVAQKSHRPTAERVAWIFPPEAEKKIGTVAP
jgi:hypothetical protein